jgi:hypothetical protein
VALTNFPNGLSSFGIPIVGGGGTVPLTSTNGTIWFVNSVAGSNGFPGTWDQPFATLAFALANTNLQVGDTVVCMEGHTEAVVAAAGILCAKAGVNITGIGNGLGAPTINFTTSTLATLRITGAYVTLTGMRFTCGIASQASMLDLQAKGILIQNNQFLEGTATGLSFIDFVLPAANVADGATIVGNYFKNPTTGNMNHAIGLNSVQDAVEIAGNYINGSFALSGVHNITGVVPTNLNMHDNFVKNTRAAKPALNFVSAVTGAAYRNEFEPGDATVNSAIFNTAMDVSNANSGESGLLAHGSEFWYVKKAVAWTTVTTGGVAISAASIGGNIAIEDVILKTNAGTLTTATLINLQSNNANGVAVFFSTSVASLAANSTVNMANATAVANGRTVLELGKVLTLAATGLSAGGTGTVDVYVKCKRLAPGADLTAA